MSENLDNMNLKKYDCEDMLSHIENFPETCKRAWAEMKSFAPPSYYIKPNKFVILGMGASGISGDILKNLMKDTNSIIEVVHDYTIPGWVDKDTLVIANSYSGGTEETLNAFLQAREKGAKLLAIAGGGKLKSLSEKFEAPILEFSYQSQPRAAFPYLFIGLLTVFIKIGKLNISENEVEDSLDALVEYSNKVKSSTKTSSNPAKILANKIFGMVPVIYSSGTLASVGVRFKDQINENSKNFAFCETFPELCHNALESYHHPKNDVFIILLESNYDLDRVVIRQNVTAEILRKNKIKLERIKFLPCDSALSEILMATLFADYVSFYLAMLNNEDPSTIKNIHHLKAELAK